MSSRRVLQNVITSSIRLSSSRAFCSVPVLRASLVSNKGALGATTTINNVSFFNRQYNSQAPKSDIFKVVDFNDIQNIIKKDCKVSNTEIMLVGTRIELKYTGI
jgi:hypothetical protein